jgi:hypothetical protein
VTDHEKLAKLAEIEGYKTPLAMCEDRATDSVFPGICMNPECDYTTDVEGDQDAGWCENCDTGTVKSGLVLAGLV